MRRARPTWTPALLALAGVGVPASGQVFPGQAQPILRPIDQGIADVDPLARSLRQLPIDLRAPSGFDRVYDLGDGRLARIDGGLVAVFDRSIYEMSDSGRVVAVPPGTVYHIGLPADVRDRLLTIGDPDWRPTRAAPFAEVLAGGAVPTRPASLDARALFGGPDRRPTSEPVPMHRPVPATPSVFTSDQERSRVLRTLMDRAREAAGQTLRQ